MDTKTKLKVLFSSKLTPEEIKELKADIVKLEAQQAAPVKLAEVKTKDGLVLSYDGELIEGVAIMVNDPVNGTTPAPDMDYELEDGTVITVSGGIISAIKKIETPDPANTEVLAQMNTKMSAIEKDYSVKLSEQKKEFNTKIDELSRIVLSQHKMLDKLVNAEFETITESGKVEKSYEEMTNAEKVKFNRGKL